MAHTQLKGRIFKRGSVSYLVVEDNDFAADMLRVKTIDSRRSVYEMPLRAVLDALAGTAGFPSPGGRGFA